MEGPGATTATSTPRALAVQRAVLARELHQRLTLEFVDVVPPGQVLASVMRIACALERSGCPRDRISAMAERLAREQLAGQARRIEPAAMAPPI